MTQPSNNSQIPSSPKNRNWFNDIFERALDRSVKFLSLKRDFMEVSKDLVELAKNINQLAKNMVIQGRHLAQHAEAINALSVTQTYMMKKLNVGDVEVLNADVDEPKKERQKPN